MKGVIFYIAFVFCCLLPVSTVYAGSLNEYEEQVVAEARKTYAYQGKMYQVPEEYIDQLIAYLSQDDVDITAEQRDKALQTAYNSIEQGVLEGYLIPVEEPSQPSGAEAEEVSPEELDPEIVDPEEVDSEEVDSGEADPREADTEEQLTATVAPKSNSEPSESTPDKELLPDEIREIDQLFKETDHTSVITETGFDFENTIYVIVGIVMLMIFGFIAHCRLNYFAQDDE